MTRCLADSRVATQISNNFELLTTIPAITKNNGPGSYVADVIYRDGPPSSSMDITIRQAAALVDISQSCSQTVMYRCESAVLLNTPGTPYGWWVSRNDEKIVSWGGAPTNSRRCGCGVTNSCYNRTKMCNCDANEGGRALEDFGALTEKRYLPVKQLRFGYEDVGNNPHAFYSLGKLSCRNRGMDASIITK